MEENVRAYFRAPNWTEIEARGQNPLVLAYIGDGVFELFVRSYILRQKQKVSKLHRASAEKVKAQAQAALALSLSSFFTEEEAQIFKRGRNTHQKTVAKNADILDYRNATGLECLIGYLYTSGKEERLREYFLEIERIWEDEG